MVRSHRFRLSAALVAATLLFAACGDDDSEGPSSATVGPGSGIEESQGSTTDDPLVQQAVADYKDYVLEQIDLTIAGTTTLTDAVRAGDLAAAKAAYAPSRQGWERIEPIAGLVEEIDGAVDARVDDFEGVDDPGFTGWHRIEYILWELDTTDGAEEFADGLDENLQTLRREVEDMDIPPAALPVGVAELIEEVSTGKITGEEDRYSGTDLWDFAANVEGAEAGFALLRPALEHKDADLASEIDALFAELDTQLSAYEDGDGYKPYRALTSADKTEMQTTLADLSEHLAEVAGVLGLG